MTDQPTPTDAVSTTDHAADQAAEGGLTDRLVTFLDRYCTDGLSRLYEGYPNDVSALVMSVRDLRQYDADIAADVLDQPDTMASYFQDALAQYDSPASVVDVSEAAIRYTDLPDTETFYPGEFSPSDHAGAYRSIQGEVAKATEVFPKLVEGAFECQRCGTVTYGTSMDGVQCEGCERQGPFKFLQQGSTFVDAQVLRVQTPPEEAGGAGEHLDVRVEDDLAGQASVGDRVTVSGVLGLEGRDNDATRFDLVVDGRHIRLDESDRTDLDVSTEQRERVHALAAGEEGDPLELAAASLAPKIYGYDHIKQMLILAMVGGSRTVHPSGDADRGEFHVLLVGDPSTAKSKLVDRVEDVGWRTVGVSGKGATTAGVTASAAQDDFGDGEWTLSAGAFVKANRGVVCVDELDDMESEVRAAMLEPMSKQSIHITKAGINTHLRTQTAVVASANPKNGRFDTYTNVISQLTFGGPLLSRFDLVYTFSDEPDPDQDAKITDHMLRSRDTAKRLQRGDTEVADEDTDRVTPPVEPETLRVWLALAKQQPPPVFESEAVREQLKDRFAGLRGLYDYGADEPVPVTFRKLEATVRIAEAAAKFEFSDVITERHARIATEAVGRSMQDFGKDENGNLDADVQEVGQSQSQKQIRETLVETVLDLQTDHDPAAPVELVVDEMEDLSERQVWHHIEHFKEKGEMYEPEQGHIRYIGGA